jgi:membrane protein YqaA with SNARE-associated domain
MKLLRYWWIWLAVVGLSAIITAAKLALYYLGRGGKEVAFKRVPRLQDDHWGRLQALCEKHGAGLLFFSFIPVVGLALEVVAGAVGVRLVVYLLWVFLGRLFFYVLLALAAEGGLQLFGG